LYLDLEFLRKAGPCDWTTTGFLIKIKPLASPAGSF